MLGEKLSKENVENYNVLNFTLPQIKKSIEYKLDNLLDITTINKYGNIPLARTTITKSLIDRL